MADTTAGGEQPQSHIPSLAVVTAAYDEVLEHNSSIGIGFGSVINAMTMVSQAEGSLDDPEPESAIDEYSVLDKQLDKTKTENDMHGDLQHILHEDTFTRVGIRLAPLGQHLKDGGKPATSIRLLPVIDNTELYVDFLTQLEPEEVQKDEASLALMTDAIRNLRDLIIVAYGDKPAGTTSEEVEAAAEYGEAALRTFSQLEPIYQKLGLDNPEPYRQAIAQEVSGFLDDHYALQQRAINYLEDFTALQSYVDYWGQGVLTEAIAVGPLEYLAENKANYFDGMHDQLTADATEIIDLTEAARTHDFGVEAAKALLSGLAKTIKEMDDEPDVWFASDKNRTLLNHLTGRLQKAIGPIA